MSNSFLNIGAIGANALYNSVSSVKNITNLWSESIDKNYSLLINVYAFSCAILPLGVRCRYPSLIKKGS